MTPAPAPTTTMAGTQSIAGLTTKIQNTAGDIPPSLMGATSTIVGDQLYLFGGRLQASAQVYNRLYVLDLNTQIWTRIFTKNDAPSPRYFHSANVCHSMEGDKKMTRIIFYGGLTVSTTESNGLRSLGDLSILVLGDDQNENEPYWEYPELSRQEYIPHERYSHLTTMTHDDRYLVVLGGQDVNAGYIDEINIYNCRQKKWHEPYVINSHYCTYRTAVSTVTPISPSISIPSSSSISGALGNPSVGTPPLAPPGKGNNSSVNNVMLPGEEENRELEEAMHRQKLYSTIFTYSNYNFYDLKRTLHQITISNKGYVADFTDYTQSLIGSRQHTPPALRFPSGFACGHHLIVVGPNITPESQQLHIWALNVVSMSWSRIDAGPALAQGSWLRGLLYEDRNQFIVFGHPGRSMHADHTQRIVHFDHFASIDTEAFGVYRPPRLTFGPAAQEAGLALLSNPALSDITMISIDGYRVRANSKILAQRWPSVHSRLTPLVSPKTSSSSFSSIKYTLTFPDCYDILVAFLQFLYTDHLTTVEQNQPRILTRLLLLADLFSLERLKALTVHSLHQMLQISTAPDIYQTAALADCASLQIRALRVMVNAKKMIQQQQNQQQQNQQQQPRQQQQQSQTKNLVDRLAPPIQQATASSPSGSTTYQPLSKLLRYYDINVPIPPTTSTASPDIVSNNNNNINNGNNGNNSTSITTDLDTFPTPPTPLARNPHQRVNTAPPLRAKNPSRKSSNSTTTTASPTTPHTINNFTLTSRSRPSTPSSKSIRKPSQTAWLPMTF
ncbi:hypothetical protein INT45_012367 [Circinella minor]|uniref:BTB domain-containing protein n=1 Tax=Circinella minor TaxID=1195481 RepID=A0A8H7S1Z0_9FUNG|nr:hypothetical protein INT45_012367 [Circinella minor]